MTNDKKQRFSKAKAAEFFRGKGTYIVLLGCLCAVGVTAFVTLSAPGEAPGQEVRQSGDERLESAAVPSPVAEGSAVTVPTPVLEADAPTPYIVAEPSADSAGDARVEAAADEAAIEPKNRELLFAPVEGELLMAFADGELLYSKTLNQWTSHSGIDIAAAEGSAVRAVADGEVNRVEYDTLMGYSVALTHAGGLETTYSNLDALPAFSEGDSVSAGEQIGVVGTSAIAEIAEDPHLHFELRKDGELVDPAPYVRGLMSLPVK